MSVFTDYAAMLRQRQYGQGAATVPLTNPAGTVETAASPQYSGQSAVEQTGQTMPQIDTSNAIGSLASLLGPTPAEREAMIRRAQEGKAKMAVWTGLFDGLRQLGNLYETARGASPQRYTDNPYGQIEQQYQQQLQLADNMAAYQRQYAQALYNLQRQENEDRRKELLTNAQAKYYDTRDEVSRMKAENDQLSAMLKGKQVVKMPDGSLILVNKEAGTAEQIKESDPLYEEYRRSQINKNNRAGTSGGRGSSGVTTTENIYNDDGKVVKKIVTKGGSGGTKKNNAKSRVSIHNKR